jgi:hypothetical protein
MSQISRPFQIALLAVAVLGAAWLFVFQPRSTSTAPSSSSAAVVSTPPPSASASAAAKATGSASKIYHGSAPGVQGLTRAIARAHEAVTTSKQNAKTLEQKAAQASGQPSTSAASSTPAGASVTKSAASAPTKSTSSSSKSTSSPASKGHAPRATSNTRSSIPSGQRSVETELAHGNVVVVLFWNPSGTDDEVVHRELLLLRSIHHRIQPYAGRPLVKRLLKAFGFELDKKIAVNVASASQTASFGSITRGVQVYGTPTMLVIDKHGKAIVLTGLQDTFSIEQAIDEARNVA